MKICLLANAKSVHTQRWIKVLRKMGHEVCGISLRHGDIENCEFCFFEPEYNSFLGKACYLLLNLPKIRKKIFAMNPDLIHAHYVTNYGLLGMLIRRSPFIVSVWGSDLFTDYRKSLFNRFLIRKVLRQADLVTYMAHHMRKYLVKMGIEEKKLLKVTLGINTDIFNYIKEKSEPRDRIVIISNRTLEKEQNVSYFIRALPYLEENTTNVEVRIYGTGSYKNEIYGLVEELGVKSVINFMGVVPYEQMPDHLKKGDIYVSSSTSDGDHVSLMEAMACGLFPVVTDLPVNREWIEDGKNGFLVPLNDPVYFAEKITEAVKKPYMREQTAEINYNLIRNKAPFGKDLIELEKRYRKLVPCHPSNGRTKIVGPT